MEKTHGFLNAFSVHATTHIFQMYLLGRAFSKKLVFRRLRVDRRPKNVEGAGIKSVYRFVRINADAARVSAAEKKTHFQKWKDFFS